MTEKEFREKMFKAKNDILKGNSLAILIWINFNCREEISKLYDFYDFSQDFGCTYNKKNQLMRIDALSFFEEYCISEKLYKEW